MSLYRHTRGTGLPLVLLHGWGMNAAVWEPLLPGLAERFAVTVMELPGHGASPPADGGLDAWADRCLDAAPSRAWWLGWSLGGQVVLQVALRAPERVEGLSLVASTPRFVQADDWPDAMPAVTFTQFADALAADPAATLQRFLALQVRGAADARETLRGLRSGLNARPPASDAGLAQGLAILETADLRDALGRLRCRTHWIFGERDTLVPARVAGAVARLLPDAAIDIVAGAAHAPFLSHPYPSLARLFDRLA
jgi:pimeloyl-[acyl-carrier protein] methyl ester esterase